jgi:hypothetical protein
MNNSEIFGNSLEIWTLPVNGAAKIGKERLVLLLSFCHLLVLFFVFFVDKLNIYELNCH